MLRRIRQYVRNESLGITIPVGVVLGLTLQALIAFTVEGFEFGHDSEIKPLGISFYYTYALPYAIAFLVLAALTYVLFIMPIASDTEPELDIRECPECKSDIFAEATRCAFCTSPVTPLDATARTP